MEKMMMALCLALGLHWIGLKKTCQIGFGLSTVENMKRIGTWSLEQLTLKDLAQALGECQCIDIRRCGSGDRP